MRRKYTTREVRRAKSRTKFPIDRNLYIKRCELAIAELTSGRQSALEFLEKDDISGCALELKFAVDRSLLILKGKNNSKI